MAVSSVSTSFHPMRHPPFRVCGRGNQKQQAFYVPRRLPEEARPPALADNTLTPPKRQDQYIIERQISQSGDKNRNFLPKNFVLPVDKSGRWGYYKCNITKMAVKRRVGFRIDPSREPGRWKRAGNREPKMVSELRGRSARVLSPRRERPLQRPAVSSGRRKPLPQHRGRAREGAVNQGGTTEVLCAFVLVGSCPPRTEALFSCFRLHKAQKNVLRSAKK